MRAAKTPDRGDCIDGEYSRASLYHKRRVRSTKLKHSFIYKTTLGTGLPANILAWFRISSNVLPAKSTIENRSTIGDARCNYGSAEEETSYAGAPQPQDSRSLFLQQHWTRAAGARDFSARAAAACADRSHAPGEASKEFRVPDSPHTRDR